MRLRSKLILIIVSMMVTNAITLIAAAPPRFVHPIAHFFFIILGILNLVSIGYMEYLASFDYRKRM